MHPQNNTARGEEAYFFSSPVSRRTILKIHELSDVLQRPNFSK